MASKLLWLRRGGGAAFSSAGAAGASARRAELRPLAVPRAAETDRDRADQ